MTDNINKVTGKLLVCTDHPGARVEYCDGIQTLDNAYCPGPPPIHHLIEVDFSNRKQFAAIEIGTHTHNKVEYTDLEFEPDVADSIIEVEYEYRTDADGTDYDVLETYFRNEWISEVTAKALQRSGYGINEGTLWFGVENETGGNVVQVRSQFKREQIRKFGSVSYKVVQGVTCYYPHCSYEGE